MIGPKSFQRSNRVLKFQAAHPTHKDNIMFTPQNLSSMLFSGTKSLLICIKGESVDLVAMTIRVPWVLLQ